MSTNRKPDVPPELLVLFAKVSKADLMEALHGVAQIHEDAIGAVVNEINLHRQHRGEKAIQRSTLRRRIFIGGRWKYEDEVEPGDTIAVS